MQIDLEGIENLLFYSVKLFFVKTYLKRHISMPLYLGIGQTNFVWNCHPKAQHVEPKVVVFKPIIMNHQHWNKKLSIEIMMDFGWFYPFSYDKLCPIYF
jgi:hypothetical protein